MTKKKFTYSKMTFILSIVGFIGSIGFYLGVLREVYAQPDNIQLHSMELEQDNKQLKSQVQVLTEMVEACNENE